MKKKKHQQKHWLQPQTALLPNVLYLCLHEDRMRPGIGKYGNCFPVCPCLCLSLSWADITHTHSFHGLCRCGPACCMAVAYNTLCNYEKDF